MISNNVTHANNTLQNQTTKQQIPANSLGAMPSTQAKLSTLQQNVVPLVKNTLSQLKQQQVVQNNIVGTTGHDVLSANSTSNLLDGGLGYDLAILQGETDDYDISIRTVSSQAGSPPQTTFVFTDEETGREIVAKNIESFRFDDTELTAAELKEYITDIDLPEELDLSDEMHNKLDQYFSKNTANSTITYDYTVLDSDGSGELNKGDMVRLSVTSQGDSYLVEHVLTQQDINSILNNSNPLLDISNGVSEAQKSRLNNAIFPQNINHSFGAKPTMTQLTDSDNNNQLSVGDLITIRRYNDVTQSFDTSTETLTQAQLDRYLAGESYTINRGQPLILTDEQQAAISARFTRVPTPHLQDARNIAYTGITNDTNGDGQLSEGDIVELRYLRVFSIQPPNQPVDHILTAEDIIAINEDRSNPLLNISNGLSDEQRTRLSYVLDIDTNSNNNPSNSIVYVFDANKDDKISIGDVVAVRTTFTITGGPRKGETTSQLFFYPLNQLHIDKFLSNNGI